MQMPIESLIVIADTSLHPLPPTFQMKAVIQREIEQQNQQE